MFSAQFLATIEWQVRVASGKWKNMKLPAHPLLGQEGVAAKAYFACLPQVLRENVPDEFRLQGRSKRPPQDRFNSLGRQFVP